MHRTITQFGARAQGISSQGAVGGQVAFVVVTNPPNSGAFSASTMDLRTNGLCLPIQTSGKII